VLGGSYPAVGEGEVLREFVSPGGRVLGPSGSGRCSSLRVWAGWGFEAWSEKTLKRKKSKRVTAVGLGQL